MGTGPEVHTLANRLVYVYTSSWARNLLALERNVCLICSLKVLMSSPVTDVFAHTVRFPRAFSRRGSRSKKQLHRSCCATGETGDRWNEPRNFRNDFRSGYSGIRRSNVWSIAMLMNQRVLINREFMQRIIRPISSDVFVHSLHKRAGKQFLIYRRIRTCG